MRFIALLLLVSAAAASAQNPAPPPLPNNLRKQKVIAIKHVSPERLTTLFSRMAVVVFDSTLKVLVVDGTPEAVALIEETVRTLDVPPAPARNLEILVQLIVAGKSGEGRQKLGPDLDGVTRNLTNLFGYKTFYLLDAILARTQDGKQVEATGFAPAFEPDLPESAKTIVQMRLQPHLVPSSSGNLIRLERLNVGLRVPYNSGPKGSPNTQFQFREAGINTQVDVREGQKVVVGKANVDGTDGALIVVVSAKVVD